MTTTGLNWTDSPLMRVDISPAAGYEGLGYVMRSLEYAQKIGRLIGTPKHPQSQRTGLLASLIRDCQEIV